MYPNHQQPFQYNQPPPGVQYQQQPLPPQSQNQYQPPQQQQQQLPPPPPPLGTTYQGYVKGLHGWNDPPSLIGSQSRKNKSAATGGFDEAAILKSVENPIAHVLTVLTAAMDEIKQSVIQDPIQRKVLEDTDKRLEELLERLGTQQVSETLLAHLVVLANAFRAKDIQAASKTTMTLTLMSTENPDDAHWIVGSKRLVEMYARHLQGGF